MGLVNLFRMIVGHIKSHSWAYSIASLGFEIDVLYFTYLFIGSNLMASLISIETLIILLAIPSFIAVGHLSESGVKLKNDFEEYSNTFEKKFEEMNATLQKTTEELKSLDKVKDNLIANVSHELKTPLTIAMSGIELAIDEESKKERNEILQVTRDSFIRQKRVIDNLLVISQHNEDTLGLNMVGLNISEVIASAVEDMQNCRMNKGIELKVMMEEGLPMVRGHFEKLEHVFNNLLDNAIKFNKEGGEIIIKARQISDFVEVAIKDTGIGIAKEMQENIFDMLYQIDSTTTRNYDGTGMGIPVAKQIIEAHGGCIWVESTLEEGTCIYFTLSIDDGMDMEEDISLFPAAPRHVSGALSSTIKR